MDRNPGHAVALVLMMPPRPPLTVTRLSDHFGQYVLILKCACGHSRTANPRTLARLAGWDATLKDVVSRLRCSQCGKRTCSASVRPETKRDG
jgi:hypothetical protein